MTRLKHLLQLWGEFQRNDKGNSMETKTTDFGDLGSIFGHSPRRVREREILRSIATLSDHDKARNEVLHWVQNRSGKLPQEAWNHQSFEQFVGGRGSRGVRFKSGQADIWAIRADDPDKYVPGRTWTTEIVIGKPEKNAAIFSVRQLVSISESDPPIEPHSPGFIRQIAEKCGLQIGEYSLSIQPRLIKTGDAAKNLVKMLVDARRKLPVFALTVPEDETEPLLNAKELGRAVLGLAHVVVLSPEATWVLTEEFGRSRSVFGGAIRAYMPGFDEDATPYHHRLIVADRLRTDEDRKESRQSIKRLAADESLRRLPLGKEIHTFLSIRNTSLIRQVEEDKKASHTKKLETARKQIKTLQEELKSEKESSSYYVEEYEKERKKAENYQARVSSLESQVEQLTNSKKTSDEDTPLPESWENFEEWCEEYLGGRLTLSGCARRGTKSPKFQDVFLAARCLLWLANNYHDKLKNGGKPRNKEPVDDGIRNEHCGCDAYKFKWRKKHYHVNWHIKKVGNTRDPARCLRIYYFWDEESQQIVIADMPAHRKTGAS